MKLNDKNRYWQNTVENCMNLVPLKELRAQLKLFDFSHFPNAEELNLIAQKHVDAFTNVPLFKANQLFEDDERYYEEIVCQSNQVPTRENSWHDFFNALIWLQFPRTKRLLSELHQQDISSYGINPRTRRRNHITHFDECGIILAIPSGNIIKGNELLSLLANHQWNHAFIDKREEWGRTVLPVVFGHAMLEMMLAPFIGLTAKWLAVEVCEEFAELSFQQRNRELDSALLRKINALNNFDIKHPLKPLPVLGVPNWYASQSEKFYSNTEYFRPLRRQNEWPDYILV
ncbi:DUF3025 domain-containing protein [Alteromonas sp. ASW11-130]|uniref:DUF3025 domain-containing protein n=1 Tax=Alteromonas sp. ASW11-130 TaxID=3015775 RepID=UPI0022427F49|nr:DUF3025 domain-containing protein [Alteromonas sp. ASW11-130]MCW8093065.1 DUF3025 domain-containing protein [Alteromonas sp. ASW11-130]